MGAGPRGHVAGIIALVLLGVFGFPAQCSKTRGGLRVDWIGFHCDYVSFRIGLSETRAAWLSDWCGSTVKQGVIGIAKMSSGLGAGATRPWS